MEALSGEEAVVPTEGAGGWMTPRKTDAPRVDPERMRPVYSSEVLRRIALIHESQEAAALVAGRGYGELQLAAGRGLATHFLQCQEACLEERERTRRCEEIRLRAVDEVLQELRLLRNALRRTKNNELIATLGMGGRIPQDATKRRALAQSCLSVENLPNNNRNRLQRAVTAQELALAEETAAMQDLALATERRDDAYRVLSEWTQAFYRAIRVALAKRSDLLFALGL